MSWQASSGSRGDAEGCGADAEGLIGAQEPSARNWALRTPIGGAKIAIFNYCAAALFIISPLG